MLAVLALALVLRLWQIGHQGLWLDELLAMANSTGHGLEYVELPTEQVIEDPPRYTGLEGAAPAWSIWTSADLDSHPPFYFMLLRGWRAALGSGDVEVRLLSVALSLAAIVLLYGAVRELHGPGPALLACVLMAASATQVHYAQEARNYALLVAEGMAACWAAARIHISGFTWLRGGAIALLLLLMMLTHYFAFGAAAGIAAFLLVRLRGRPRWALLSLLAVAGVVYLVAWGPFLVRQLPVFAAQDWLREESSWSAAVALKRFLTLPTVFLWYQNNTLPAVSMLAGVSYLAFLVVRRRPELVLWIFWFAGAAGLVLLLDLLRGSKHLEYSKYTLLAAPALFVAVAVAAWQLRPRWRLAVATLLAVLCAIALPSAYTLNKPPWVLAAANLQQSAGRDDLIVFARSYDPSWVPPSLYLSISHYAPNLRAPIVFQRRAPAPEVAQKMRSVREIWIVTQSPLTDVGELLPFEATVEQVLEWPNTLRIWRATPAAGNE